MYTFSSSRGISVDPTDLVGDACKKANTDDVNLALSKLGYQRQFEIGNPELASIELFRSYEADSEFAALVHLTIGNDVELYGIYSSHEVLVFMKEYVPTIKAMNELADMKFN